MPWFHLLGYNHSHEIVFVKAPCSVAVIGFSFALDLSEHLSQPQVCAIRHQHRFTGIAGIERELYG